MRAARGTLERNNRGLLAEANRRSRPCWAGHNTDRAELQWAPPISARDVYLMELKGKTIVVTSAGRGLGQKTAEMIAAKGDGSPSRGSP